ncbi:hypothetical protein HZS61_004441 [Fusarium oxysporum f. sp. conglutinans]|uniref:HAT C-terminal dimerisation domain-containing protein n=2 Tax=Fusarium oxysporum TaxID=5507 RepID=A0A8H6GE35_FUSOX|nr:hypothetical protein HZS61_004441 [Fusarium oxysporum f. sp. conglutinans]
MPQQRLSFAQWSQRRESSISGDLLEFSSQQSDDLDVSQKSKCLSSRPRTVSTTSSTKPRTSWVFSHMPDEEVETRYYNQRTGKEEWRCKHCDKTYASSGGTAAPAKHLMDPPPDGHGLPKGASRTAKVTTIRTIIEQARVAAEENPRKRRRLNDQSGDSIEPDQLEALYVRFITACSLPFRLVECPEFRALLAYINNDIETWLPDTHNTVKTWIMRQYECQKERVKQRIQSAKSRIHISCDLWTSPNSLAILGVVAHYVTEDGQLEHHVLALKDIDSEHDGSHLAVAILKVVDEWGFASKLRYFVMDNAGNNDTMMRSLSLGLLRRYDIQYDPKVHRLRCQGHIINLAAKAFLFVTDNEKLELDDPGVHNVTLKHIEAWRKKGPLGKIHNFVVFIQRSVQRSQKFLTISHNRKLARDNDTRWSSWYNMLRVALNLRDAIDGYFNKWMELDCAGDELSSEDWIILEKIKSFLEKLKMTTKALESSFATLDNVLLAMDFVLAQFEAGKEAYIDDPIMAPMYNSGWAKLDKYYRLTDESPAYVAAIVLHPSHKWHYIQENWKKEWVESSKKLMETLWNDYKPVESPLPLCEVPSTTTNEFLNWRNKHLQPSLVTDEYERYCNSERTSPVGSTGRDDDVVDPTIASVLKLDVNKPTEQNIANSFISRFDKQHFQRMLVELIVSSNQSFSFAENPILREIFGYLNPSVSIQHANLSATAVRYKIIQEYNRHKQKVIEVLRDSPGALHISFDGWTSRNKLALYGIACFFRDEKNRPCKIMIGVPEAHRHFGSTIGGEVLDVLHTLGVSPEKIGSFTLDNAENNDTAMEVIGAELGFDGRLRRGRCFGHTINLSAKALLFGKNADAFEQQLSGAEALSDTEYARWRKRGPVGKLHNIVVDVRISHRLIYLFKEVQTDEINRATTLKLRSKKPLKLIIDNDTRWLSQLYMIRRALRLKTSIELLLIKYKAQWEDENRSKKTGQVTQAKLAKKPRILRDENQLTDKDWEVLYHLEAILTVFETVVKTLEGDGHIRRRKQGWTGSYGNIWDVVLGYELLLNTLEEYKQLAADFPDPEHFRIGINLAWDKLDEYYRRLDETPIYYTAMALHPAYRWDWFDETWAHKPSWVEKAKEMVADVWLSDYAHLEVRTSSSRGDDEPPAKRPRFFNPFEKNSRLPSSKPAYAAAIVVDEYQAWQTDREASDGNVRDPIGYWITKQGRYPRLSRMALDFLTIQPMSAECERLFSAAGKMVSGLRTNLDAEIIAICQVLRSWYRAGLIKDLDPLLKSHLESKLDGGCGTLSDDELALAESKWLLEGEDSASEVDDSTQQQQAEESVSTSESEAE